MKTNKPLIMLFILILGTGWVLVCSAFQVDAIVPYNETSQVIIDGTINHREYTGLYEETSTGIRIHWEHNGENMYIGIISPGTGWVSIGFSSQKMDSANLIIGAVDDTGTVTLSDQFAKGWSHNEDTQDNIVEKAGSQNAEGTSIEFVFPLNSGDSSDHSFKMGATYGFIVAYHATSDNFDIKHTKRVASLSLQIESLPETTRELTTEPTTMIMPETTEVPELVIMSVHMLIFIIFFGTIYITHYWISRKYL